MEQDDPAPESIELVIERGNPKELEEHLESLPPEELGYVMRRLDPESISRLMEVLSESNPELARSLMEHLVDAEAASLISLLPPAAAAAIVEVMDSDDRADVFSRLEDVQTQDDILSRLDPQDADDLRHLVAYAPDTAGGLMITEYLAHRSDESIAAVLSNLRENASDYVRYDVQYLYVVESSGELSGVIRLRDLVLSSGELPLAAIAIRNPACVRAKDGLQQLEAFFDDHAFFAAPVINDDGVLVGVVRRAAVEEARAEHAGRALMAFGGIIGGDELRSMPTKTRIGRRLMFLCPNILLNLIAASVVAVYEPTIAAVTALAIFLPMLSDMSGCAGNQAVAVSIRELSLGVLKPRDLRHALSKEVGVGVVNGIVLGSLIGLIAWVMRGHEWPLIGVVVGGAMCINSIVAVTIGGTVPLLLKRVGVDPALAASPILTTFTDLCGFFLTLRLATAVLL